MKKKRVVIDVNSAMPQYSLGWTSGIGRTTKELVEALNKIEKPSFDIMLYSQNTKGIDGRRLNTHFKNRHLYLPNKSWMNRMIGMTHLREWTTNYDLLHIPHNFEWVRKPERTLVTIHDAMFFAYPDDVFNYEYYQRVYPTLAKQCKGIITCSESSKNDIMQYMDIPEDKIFVCPWGYRKDIYYPRENTNTVKPYFLMVSCSLGRKNSMTAIRAYEKFLKNAPSHELKIIWPNTPLSVLEYCGQTHLKGHIHIQNKVDDNTLGIMYSNATATFFPSRYEGFGLPVLESMACGTPVVTCRNSSLPEVGGDAALYVDPDDIDAMCDYMEKFEQHSIDCNDLKQRCLNQASLFSWEKCANQTMNIYNQLLETL